MGARRRIHIALGFGVAMGKGDHAFIGGISEALRNPGEILDMPSLVGQRARHDGIITPDRGMGSELTGQHAHMLHRVPPIDDG